MFEDLKYNLYEILNVDSDTDDKIIKKQINKIIKYFHPDNKSKLEELEEDIYSHIIFANKILMDKKLRKEYDLYISEKIDTYIELKTSFSNTKNDIKKYFPDKNNSLIDFTNKLNELNKKHNNFTFVNESNSLEREFNDESNSLEREFNKSGKNAKAFFTDESTQIKSELMNSKTMFLNESNSLEREFNESGKNAKAFFTDESTINKYNRIKNTRDIIIKKINIKNLEDFNNKFDNYKLTTPNNKNKNMELTEYIIPEYYTNINDLDKLYTEEESYNKYYGHLNKAFNLL
jgi:hypothetical protein